MGTVEFKNVSKHFVHWENRPDNIKRSLAQMLSGQFKMGRKDNVSVLENLSFKIGVGEFIGIMGRNGAGKSTLLKLISNIYKPNSGIVTVNGKVAPLLALGAGFAEELSGYENIYLNSAILGFSESQTRTHLKSIMDFSELGDRIYMPVKNYSSGMLVRLAFSIAAHMESDILLFDEVLAVGDVGFQNKCLKKIKELHSEGKTVILVTHSPEQIKQHCQRVILIQNRHVFFDGSAEEGGAIYSSWF